jgi:hypothetical protein
MFKDRAPKRVAKKAAKDADKAAQQQERDQARFRASPVGQAASAYERGFRVFQTSLDLTRMARNDPSEVLNAICEQGWELINGSYSMDGIGYYLFRRADVASPTRDMDPPRPITAQQWPLTVAQWRPALAQGRLALGRRVRGRTR